MVQLQQNASGNALNGCPRENNAISSLSVMEALALCAMHFLRRASLAIVCVCVCVCVCQSHFKIMASKQHIIPAYGL